MNVGEFYLNLMAKDSNKINDLNATHSNTLDLIQYWKSFLGINEWEILCESISEMQVVDALDNNTVGHEFVGISIKSSKNKICLGNSRH